MYVELIGKQNQSFAAERDLCFNVSKLVVVSSTRKQVEKKSFF